MKYKNIIFKEEGKVCTIQLNRPGNLNALCDELITEVNDCLNYIEHNNNLSVLVLKGSEKAFAAGADILEMSKKSYIDHINRDFIKPWEKISKFEKPIING